ncbi:ADP-ribosylation/crystallin J1 [Phytomonospora endophytica]|uniref:ADP-ribosylation/crystallin J1 n=1 Tax=Phytomonospora endophytica TaxID=714109 RepID=UPI00161236F9|nr:ADP-ribosylation/crystallin J1 [Phytomonospora endophytica]
MVTEALAGRVENPDGTTTLWRPTGPAELRLVEESGRRRWPPRLPEQPIFYPVLNEAYAERIAREWNVPDGGRGIITRFRVETAYVRRFPTRRAGGGDVLELWVPAAELDEFNDHIVGRIEVVGEF